MCRKILGKKQISSLFIPYILIDKTVIENWFSTNHKKKFLPFKWYKIIYVNITEYHIMKFEQQTFFQSFLK